MFVVGVSSRPGTRASRGLLGWMLASVILAGCAGPRESASVGNDAASRVSRGEYLVAVTGCGDCHTPLIPGPDGTPIPDPARTLAGHPAEIALVPPSLVGDGWAWAGAASNTAFAGPWGVSFAPNLTPAAGSGLGLYTEDSFVQALRTGKHFGVGRPILPPMPWTAYARMTDEDLRAIYAYLSTLPAVDNTAPNPLPPSAAVPAALR